jgi:rhodanese-related sulfurtransferase
MKTIKKEELQQKMADEQFHLVEVLDSVAYNKEHIKGAKNIPLEKIGSEATELFDKDDQIVVYCSDYDCTASPTEAKKLDALGFKNVYDYEGGKKEWKEAGLPME